MVDMMHQLEPHRRRLWGLAYRMTGSAADADELVQETFVRAIERPPADVSRPIDSWLTKVAANLSRDRLRARKLRPYVGPWLPTPMRDSNVDIEPGADTRYDVHESLSLAFLHALEVLTPKQRAVLLLRDVLGYAAAEVADALELTEGAVKTQLHRARAALAPYHAVTRPTATARDEMVQTTIAKLVASLTSRDHEAMAELLRDDVQSLSDGGGKLHAALKPIRGRAKVIKFTFGVASLRGDPKSVVPTTINGLPGLLFEFDDGRPKHAQRAALAIDIDEDGRIARMFTILVDDKLDRVF